MAARKNLFGAPAIAAALASHPEVRDAAVLVYPDRLAGAGLYAFVEAKRRSRKTSCRNSWPRRSAGTTRRNSSRSFPPCPAMPAARCARDILQLVATNQVDDIEPLITSDAERSVVDAILNARHNMRDRFVM